MRVLPWRLGPGTFGAISPARAPNGARSVSTFSTRPPGPPSATHSVPPVCALAQNSSAPGPKPPGRSKN